MFRDPPTSLDENGVVVTIWYRAPELLLMSKHYTPAIGLSISPCPLPSLACLSLTCLCVISSIADIWAVGCMFGELLTCTPMFRSKEAQHTSQRPPFQEQQLMTIFRALGTPHVPLYHAFPRWEEASKWEEFPETLSKAPLYCDFDPVAMSLLRALLEYDPAKRLTAEQALQHPYFRTQFSTTKFVAVLFACLFVCGLTFCVFCSASFRPQTRRYTLSVLNTSHSHHHEPWSSSSRHKPRCTSQWVLVNESCLFSLSLSLIVHQQQPT